MSRWALFYLLFKQELTIGCRNCTKDPETCFTPSFQPKQGYFHQYNCEQKVSHICIFFCNECLIYTWLSLLISMENTENTVQDHCVKALLVIIDLLIIRLSVVTKVQELKKNHTRSLSWTGHCWLLRTIHFQMAIDVFFCPRLFSSYITDNTFTKLDHEKNGGWSRDKVILFE
jgi:hypothetical protein